MRIIFLLLLSVSCFAQSPRVITLNGVPIPLNVNGSYTIPSSGAAFTLTTSGTSGAATYSGGVLNIPIYSGGSSYSAGFGLTLASTTFNVDSYYVATKARLYKVRDSILGIGYLTSVSLTGGTGINITGSSPSYTVAATGSLTAGSGVTVSGSFPTYTVTNASPNQTVNIAAGTGASVIGSYPSYTVAGTGSLSAGTGISVSGSFPTYTVTNTSPSSGGTVTSVGVAAGTGISVSGSPITSSGTVTVTATGSLSAGTGISIAGSFPTYTVTNSSPSSGGTVTSIATSAPLTGGTITGTGTISIPKATSTTDGYLSATDWSTFNGKGVGTVTSFSVSGSSPVFSVSVTNATTTPTLNITTLNQNPNTFLAGATSGTTTPTFRAITTGDLPATTVYSVVAGANMTATGTNTVTIALQPTINLAALTYSTTPTAPATGTVNISANNLYGIEEPLITPSGSPAFTLQGSIGQEDWGWMSTNGTAIQLWGRYASAISTSGTSTFNLRTYDATNAAPNELYNQLASLASANSSAEMWFGFTSRDAMIGNAAYGAGSKLEVELCLPAYASGSRVFVGYASTFGQISTTGDPSSLTNIIGIGKDAADATLQVMFNDGSGTATKVNTGITPTVNDVYIVTVTLPSNTTTATVCIERRTKTASTFFSYTANTNLPAAGTLMYMHAQTNTGASSTAVKLGVMHIFEHFKPY